MANLTFKEKYGEVGLRWQEKATLISLYHTAMCMKFKEWTMTDTAQHFEVSIGLVSENIRLAKSFDSSPKLAKCETREAALKMLVRGHYYRSER